MKETDLDVVPLNRQELNSARLSRYELVDIMFRDHFEDVIAGEHDERVSTFSLIDEGAYVRLMAGEPDGHGRPKYRIHKIIGKSTHPHSGIYA